MVKKIDHKIEDQFDEDGNVIDQLVTFTEYIPKISIRTKPEIEREREKLEELRDKTIEKIEKLSEVLEEMD